MIPFRVVEPTQRDINKLHQLRSMGASGHVRRRVLDFMNDLNESGKEVGGINWSGRSDDSMDDLLNNSFSEVSNKNGDKMRNIWISEKENDDDVLSNLIRSKKEEQRQQQQQQQQEKEMDIPTAVVRSSSTAVDRKEKGLDQDEALRKEHDFSVSSSQQSRPLGRKAIMRDRVLSIDTNNNHHDDHLHSSSSLGAPKEAISPIRTRNR